MSPRPLSPADRLRVSLRILRSHVDRSEEALTAMEEMERLVLDLEEGAGVDRAVNDGARGRAVKKLDELLAGGIPLRRIGEVIGENPGTLIQWRRGFWNASGRPFGARLDDRISGKVLKYEGRRMKAEG